MSRPHGCILAGTGGCVKQAAGKRGKRGTLPIFPASVKAERGGRFSTRGYEPIWPRVKRGGGDGRGEAPRGRSLQVAVGSGQSRRRREREARGQMSEPRTRTVELGRTGCKERDRGRCLSRNSPRCGGRDKARDLPCDTARDEARRLARCATCDAGRDGVRCGPRDVPRRRLHCEGRNAGRRGSRYSTRNEARNVARGISGDIINNSVKAGRGSDSTRDYEPIWPLVKRGGGAGRGVRPQGFSVQVPVTRFQCAEQAKRDEG
jgi:hypothetical protein